MTKRILSAIKKSVEIAAQGQGSENFENVAFVDSEKFKSIKKEAEEPEALVRGNYEIKKSTRKEINGIANEKEMDKKDVAQALFDYALKHKDEINFFKYKK
jgi:hypothetical protein